MFKSFFYYLYDIRYRLQIRSVKIYIPRLKSDAMISVFIAKRIHLEKYICRDTSTQQSNLYASCASLIRWISSCLYTIAIYMYININFALTSTYLYSITFKKEWMSKYELSHWTRVSTAIKNNSIELSIVTQRASNGSIIDTCFLNFYRQ